MTNRTEFEFVDRDDAEISKHLMDKFAGKEVTEKILEEITLEILTWTARRVPELARVLICSNPADINKRIVF